MALPVKVNRARPLRLPSALKKSCATPCSFPPRTQSQFPTGGGWAEAFGAGEARRRPPRQIAVHRKTLLRGSHTSWEYYPLPVPSRQDNSVPPQAAGSPEAARLKKELRNSGKENRLIS